MTNYCFDFSACGGTDEALLSHEQLFTSAEVKQILEEAHEYVNAQVGDKWVGFDDRMSLFYAFMIDHKGFDYTADATQYYNAKWVLHP